MSKISLKHSGGNVVSLNSPTNAPGAADVAFKLPNADGTNGQVIKTDGSGNLSFGSGFNPSSNVVLEQFLTFCDGTAVSTKKGSVSIENVTAVMNLTTTHTDVTGAGITNEPPDNTTLVIYKFIFYTSTIDNSGIVHYKLLIDNTEITGSRTTFRHGAASDGEEIVFEWPIPIGGSASNASGRQATWSGTKVLKLQAREYGSSYEASLHSMSMWDGSATPIVKPPLLGITAIGSA